MTPVQDQLDENTVLAALRGVIDPELNENIVDLGMVRSVEIAGDTVRVAIALTIAGCPLRDQLRRDTEHLVGTLAGVGRVEVTTGAMTKEERQALMSRARKRAQESSITHNIPSDTRVLGIVSGKGGVGKSSVSANLAVALAQRGLSIGLLDGDIWGFSIPRMLGVEGPLEVKDQKMQPRSRVIGQGIVKVVSMGFLADENEAIMWRGLVLNRALQHFLEDVDWGAIDYLIVDMPPGTGDIQMGLARMLPHTELLIVTTPALGAEKVAGRAADMARKGHLRVAGVIENMAGFTCEHGEHYALFGEGGGKRLADEIGAPLIASIPLDPTLAASSDAGSPVALDLNSPSVVIFARMAEDLTTTIAPVVTMNSCSARMVDAMEQAMQQVGS